MHEQIYYEAGLVTAQHFAKTEKLTHAALQKSRMIEVIPLYRPISQHKRHFVTAGVLALVVILQWIVSTPPAEAEPYPRKDAVVRAVEKASSAVVNISVEQIREERYPFSSRGRDPFFDQFFNDFFNSFAPREYTTHNQGSGVIINPEGYILTNEHVIAQATRITVRLVNQKDYPATLVGSDPKSDLAVLKIQADAVLPYIQMGRSDNIMIGETVIAIGNPFGLSHTVTTGVVSAIDRSIRSGERIYKDFIQTDASINPGNSGGPLLNINAELIGINTAIYQKAQGIGFAIPIDRARRIYEDLVTYGEVHKAWLGIFLQDLTPQLIQYFGLSEAQGVLISRIIKGSPGDLAGLNEGDIVVQIGRDVVVDRGSYLALVDGYRVGEIIPMTVVRNGQPLNIQIKSREFTPERAMDISREWLGLEVKEISITEREGTTEAGVAVTGVNKHSDAYRIGIRNGDLIRQVNNTQVLNIQDYIKAMEQALNSENVVILVIRDNVGYYVTLTP